MFFRSKKFLLFPSVWSGTEYRYLGTHLEEEPNSLYWSYQGIPYLFPYSQSRQEFDHFANGYINPFIVKDSLEDK